MSDAILILRTCCGLALLWAFWQYLWKGYSVDLLRQSLFCVRNELFDMALRKEMGLDFNSPVYGRLRDSLNGRIRFAHKITFSHLWLGIFISRIMGINLESYKPSVDIAIEGVENKELQTKLRTLQMKADAYFVRHMALISPLFLLTVWAGFICFLIKYIATHISFISAIRAAVRSIKSKAVEDSKQMIAVQVDTCGDDEGNGRPMVLA